MLNEQKRELLRKHPVKRLPSPVIVEKPESPQSIKFKRMLGYAVMLAGAFLAGNLQEFPSESTNRLNVMCSKDDSGARVMEVDLKPFEKDIRKGNLSVVTVHPLRDKVLLHPYDRKNYEGMGKLYDEMNETLLFRVDEDNGTIVQLRNGLIKPKGINNTGTTLDRVFVTRQTCYQLDQKAA